MVWLRRLYNIFRFDGPGVGDWDEKEQTRRAFFRQAAQSGW